MEPGRPVSLPQRIWTVDIAARFGASGAACDTCGPLRHPPNQALRDTALHHLALHALRDVTPPHLRTCQCGRHGCPWHRRHRGCAGPIHLSLTRKNSPHSWRLADMCEQCATATPHTAAVPQLLPSSADAPPATPHSSVKCEEELPQVWEVT
jgi:hypothetical protein